MGPTSPPHVTFELTLPPAFVFIIFPPAMLTQSLSHLNQTTTDLEGRSDFDYLGTPFVLPTAVQPYVSDLRPLSDNGQTECATAHVMPRYADNDSSSFGTSGQPSPDHTRWLSEVRLIASVSGLMIRSTSLIIRVPSAHVRQPPTTG